MKRKCKRGADGQTWRRLKKMAIVVFENLSVQQFFKFHIEKGRITGIIDNKMNWTDVSRPF